MDPKPMNLAPYLKKSVTLRAGPTRLELRVAHDLFSSHLVDAGSRMLLRTLEELQPPRAMLDVGCGYGPLGLGLKARFPEADLEMIDRDALAVQFASDNADLNAMEGVRAYGSLGYDDVPPDHRFDLVVCNLPGKAGEGVLEDLLLGAGRVLRPGGTAAVVVVAPLTDLVAGVLAPASVVLREEAKDYTVFHFSFKGPAEGGATASFERGIYERHRGRFSYGEREWTASTVWGLPEFDVLSYRTELMTDLMVGLDPPSVRRALVVHPGQGHLPVLLAATHAPDQMTLVDRDLLALRASAANLARNGFTADRIIAEHTVGVAGIEGRFDLVTSALEAKLPPEITLAIVDGAARATAGGGMVLLGGPSTTITRVHESGLLRDFELDRRIRKHGFSAAAYSRN